MAKVTFHDPDNKSKHVTIRDGYTILRAAKQGRVALRHKCGGKASCTTCKVKIEQQKEISTPNQKEIMKLGDRQIEKGMRLSCQTAVYGNVEAVIPEDPYQARIRALLAQQRNQ